MEAVEVEAAGPAAADGDGIESLGDAECPCSAERLPEGEECRPERCRERPLRGRRRRCPPAAHQCQEPTGGSQAGADRVAECCPGGAARARRREGRFTVDQRQESTDHHQLPQGDERRGGTVTGGDEVHPADEREDDEEAAAEKMGIGNAVGSHECGGERRQEKDHRQRRDDQLPNAMLRAFGTEERHRRTERQARGHHPQ